METWQTILVASYSLISFLLFCYGLYQTHWKKNAYGEFYPMLIIGALVWADAVIFGLFWTLVPLFILFKPDWLLFLLLFSIFWTVRGIGEIIFFLNIQFNPIKRYPPGHFPILPKIFHDESVYFIFQIIWQCIITIFIICSIYFAKLWLAKI